VQSFPFNLLNSVTATPGALALYVITCIEFADLA